MSWPSFWEQKNWISRLLTPLSKLTCWEAKRRLDKAVAQSVDPNVPVIVVGNLVVGGSGKTPFITWLALQLQQRGLRVGLVARGYGGQAKQWPQVVGSHSDPVLVGDEPVMLVKSLGCPMVVGPKRQQAVQTLLEEADVDVIISDDGLQHHAMHRDLEIVLVDAKRQFGNGQCLPAGPLREGLSRLESVDFVVVNGANTQQTAQIMQPFAAAQKSFAMQLQPQAFVHLLSGKTKPVDAFAGVAVNALAAIGNPQRFFDTLSDLGVSVKAHPFVDHYGFDSASLSVFENNKPLLMTHKDAVKCAAFAQTGDDWWYLSVAAQIEERLLEQILQSLDLSHQSMN